MKYTQAPCSVFLHDGTCGELNWALQPITWFILTRTIIWLKTPCATIVPWDKWPPVELLCVTYTVAQQINTHYDYELYCIFWTCCIFGSIYAVISSTLFNYSKVNHDTTLNYILFEISRSHSWPWLAYNHELQLTPNRVDSMFILLPRWTHINFHSHNPMICQLFTSLQPTQTMLVSTPNSTTACINFLRCEHALEPSFLNKILKSWRQICIKKVWITSLSANRFQLPGTKSPDPCRKFEFYVSQQYRLIRKRIVLIYMK